MELVGPSKRNTCGTFFTMLFGAGAIVVAVWAYFLRVQAYVLQLIFASHSLLLFGHFWYLKFYDKIKHKMFGNIFMIN